MIGGLYDLISLPFQVRDANLRLSYRSALFPGEGPPSRKEEKESIEKVILLTAKSNRGIVTPGEVALAGDWSIDESREYLEKLVAKSHAEIRVKKSGVVVYVFPEFLSPQSETELEEI